MSSSSEVRAPLLARLAVVAVLCGTTAVAGLPKEEWSWTRVDSPHFSVYSYGPEEKTRQIVDELERFRALLETMMPREAAGGVAKIPIFVFDSNAAFAPYNRPDISGDVEKFGGYFYATRFGPVIGLSLDARALYRVTVYHEAVHGYLRSSVRLPLWLEEGIAEYFSSAALLDDEVRVGLPLDHHLTEILTKQWTPLFFTLGLTGKSPTYDDADRVGPFYAYSWLAVHFLLHQGREAPMTPQVLLDSIRFGGSPDGSGLLRGLDGRLREYSKGGSFASRVVEVDMGEAPAALEFHAVDRATILVRLGELQAFAHGRLGEAEEHFRAALALTPKSADARVGLAYVLQRTDRADEAAALWQQVTAAGPPALRHRQIRAWSLLESLPRTVIMPGEGEKYPEQVGEARRLFESCVATDATSGMSQFGLGLTYGYGIADVDPGIAALERARELMRGTVEVEVSLGVLYARGGRTADAQAVLESLAVRGIDDEKTTAEIQRAIVDAQNETIRKLAEKGDYHTAIKILTGILAETTDPRAREALERQVEFLGEAAERKAPYDDYNRAIALANQGKLTEALEILDDLATRELDAQLTTAVADLRGRIRERLNQPADR